ncbi:MAG: sxtJ [Proteobacteria bacterium]|nr:sxtJ [Pseudomonadota bacterium]
MQENVDKTQLRKFGLILSLGLVAFFGLLLPYLKETHIPLWPYLAAFFLFIPTLIAPHWLNLIYTPWMKLGGLLGWINTRIILGIIFYGLITPMGIVMRLLGKDLLNLKFDDSIDSYRTNVSHRSANHMERPY